MGPDMTSGSFFRSAIAASGNPQFATCATKRPRQRIANAGSNEMELQNATGPQKCVPGKRLASVAARTALARKSILKKYSRAFGDRNHAVNVDAMSHAGCRNKLIDARTRSPSVKRCAGRPRQDPQSALRMVKLRLEHQQKTFDCQSTATSAPS